MSSSVAISSAAMARPGTTRPALSRLVATHTSQSRGIWHCARSYHSIREKMDRIGRSIDKYQRHPQANLRGKTEACNSWPATAHRDARSSRGWVPQRARSCFSELAGREKTYWDAELEQMSNRMAYLKKQVAKDPYEAIFGRRVNSSHYIDQSDTATAWPGFLRTFLGAEKPMTDHPSKAHLQDFNFTQSPVRSSASDSRDALEYDPISGRMAPKAPEPHSRSESSVKSSSAGIDCTPGSEVETKLASNPSLVEDSQFQPGSTSTTRLDTLNSQTIDCPPGSELEALFSSDSASYKNIRSGTSLPKESAHKPNINVACPPGSELEALFVSESVPSEKLQADTLKVRAAQKKLSADVGLESSQNVERAPGSELEALFTTVQDDQNRPSQESSANVYADCPPGGVLDAKYASGFYMGPQSAKEATPVDCSPGSELEARIVAETTRDQLSDPPVADPAVDSTLDSELEARIVAETTRAQLSDPSIDCSPGSELEAFFKTNPATVQASHYPETMATADADIKKANIAVDCGPGHEHEAKMVSDAASAEICGESEDLSALHASDIRARYNPLESDIKSNGAKNIPYDASEGRVGDLLQNQKPFPATQQWSQADYRILAYDSATSTVTTAGADSFFGNSAAPQPHEILSRLLNPAKFVPYFTQMQQDGYEIATGGGDILVFRRVLSTTTKHKHKHTSAAGQQDSVSADVQADIASYQCDNSYDSTSYVRHYHPSSTTKPSASGHSSSNPCSRSASGSSSSSGSVSISAPDSTLQSESSTASPKSKSFFRKVLHRMILTGTITAGSCYAIGVLTEYFRTGGQDGRGADGFTPFESERRHGE